MAAIAGAEEKKEATSLFKWYHNDRILNRKGTRVMERMVGGYWDALFGPDSDWFNLKQEPSRKKVTRGWEKHADNIRYEPGPWTPFAPPWYSTMVRGVYKGRKEWDTELDWEHPIAERGRVYDVAFAIREEDPMWWDPPVPKGQAFEGLDGVDSSYVPSFHEKGDRPMPVEEWSRIVREGSEQGRQIAARFNLSPQHPGLRINCGVEAEGAYGKHPTESGIGVDHFIASDTRTVRSLWSAWPRFWDSAIYQDPLTKVAFGAKVGLYVGGIRSAYDVVTIPDRLLAPLGKTQPYNYPGHSLLNRHCWQQALRKHMGPALAFPMTYCGALSVTAALRGDKDDLVNHVVPSALVGAGYGVWKNNTFRGFWAAGFAFTAALSFHAMRCYQYGWQGPLVKAKWNIGFDPILGTGKEIQVSKAQVPFRPSLDPPVPGVGEMAP